MTRRTSSALWPVYALAVLAAAMIIARVYWDALFERFDVTALYLLSIAGIGVLVPFALRELPRVRKLKVGGTEIELADLEGQLPNVTPVPGLEEEFKRSKGVDIRVDASWEPVRNQVKDASRDIFLVHVLRPSLTPNQTYDLFIFLARPKAPHLKDVKQAEFFFGRYWGNRIFKVVNTGKERIGVATSAYGPFLAICKITFTDDSFAWIERLIDFEMGRLFDSR